MGNRKERGLKQLPDGRWQWSYVDPRAGYHRHIARTKGEARAYLEKVKTTIREGRFLDKKKEKKITFEKAVEEFLKWGKKNLRDSTYQRDLCFTAQWLVHPLFKGKTLDQITTLDVEAYRNSRVETVKTTFKRFKKRTQKEEIREPEKPASKKPVKTLSKRTCDMELSRILRLFNLCKEWKLCKENPAEGVKMFRVESRKDKFLTHDEEKALLDHAPEFLKPAIVFSINTGLRQGELRSLTWGQVDLDRKTVTITAEKAKGKRTRRVHLNALALEALKSVPQGIRPDLSVFPAVASTDLQNLVHRFKKAVIDAGLDPTQVTWHTMRHTFCSRLIMAGVNVAAVQRLAGHQDITTTMRYVHLAEPHLQEAVDRLSNLQFTCNPPKQVVGENPR